MTRDRSLSIRRQLSERKDGDRRHTASWVSPAHFGPYGDAATCGTPSRPRIATRIHGWGILDARMLYERERATSIRAA